MLSSQTSMLHWTDHSQKKAYRIWEEGSKDIVLIHGILAHSYWWTWMMDQWPLAPRVQAPDLSGMGHSAWQNDYSLRNHIHELLEHIDKPSWLIGHSYGGLVAYGFATLFPEKVKGVILIDSPLRAWETPAVPTPTPMRRIRSQGYLDTETMKKAFVLIPEQAFPTDELKEDLFHKSITQDANGHFQWLFDPMLIQYMQSYYGNDSLHTALPHPIPLQYIAASQSPLSLMADRFWLKNYAPHTDFVSIPNAAHAVLLDQPLPLRDLITQWIEDKSQ